MLSWGPKKEPNLESSYTVSWALFRGPPATIDHSPAMLKYTYIYIYMYTDLQHEQMSGHHEMTASNSKLDIAVHTDAPNHRQT